MLNTLFFLSCNLVAIEAAELVINKIIKDILNSISTRKKSKENQITSLIFDKFHFIYYTRTSFPSAQ